MTPYIANNITGSGTNGYLAKFSSTNGITSGPAIGSDTTKFLRNDGSWAVPNYPDQIFERGGSTVGALLKGNVSGASTASGYASVSIGVSTTASGNYSFAEGRDTTASGSSSHAEGVDTVASESYAHAEGYSTTASGLASHTEGHSTQTTNWYEHASGVYNVSRPTNDTSSFGYASGTLFSIGNGYTNYNRHNAFEVRQNGDVYISATNRIGTDPGNTLVYYITPMLKLQDFLKVDSSGDKLTTSDKFIKTGGTSAQFLKADGSVDTNSYVTTGTFTTEIAKYLPLSGGTLKDVYGENTMISPIKRNYDSASYHGTTFWANYLGTISEDFGMPFQITWNDQYNVPYYMGIGVTTSGEGFIYSGENWTVGQMARDATSSNGHQVLISKIWHKDNDGSGSGLDADLLDGKHASDFVLGTYLNGVISKDASGNATVEASTIKKTGGTSSQFLKADGSVDNTAYLGYQGSTTIDDTETLWSQIGIRQYNRALPLGLTDSGSYNYGAVISFPGEHARLDVWYNHYSSSPERVSNGGIWFRSGWEDQQNSWAKLLDSNNYGSYIMPNFSRVRKTDFSLTDLQSAVAEQNLEKYGLKVGDQKTINGRTYVIAGLNCMKGTHAYTCTQNHVGLIVIPHVSQAWNESGDTSQGADGRGAGYMNSDLHYYLKNTLLPLVQTDLGADNLLAHQKLLGNAVSNGKTSGWAWEADCYISTLSEVQVYGSVVWGNAYDVGEADQQLEVFQKFKHTAIFGNEYIWLRAVVSASHAAVASNDGDAGHATASYADRVAALILFK